MEYNPKIKIEKNTEKIELIIKNGKNMNKSEVKSNKVKNFFNMIENKIIKRNNNSNPKENFEQKNKKERNPGIDLVRLISMFNIVINHYLFNGEIFKTFPRYERFFSCFHNFTDFNNNAFILISGIIGYKTSKYSNLIYLWLTVLFYSVGISKFYRYKKKIYRTNEEIYQEYYPMIYRRYWFFTSYFGMYLFLPVINKGIVYLTKYELRLVVMTTLFIFIFWRFNKNPDKNVFQMHNGFSMIWFLTLYLTGAYIGKYRVDYCGIKKYLYCFICLFTYFLVSYLFFKVAHNELPIVIGNKKIELPIAIRRTLGENFDSFSKVIQCIAVCCFFMQIKYNKYLAKIICFFGPLIFSVYLIHNNDLVVVHVLRHIFDNTPMDSNFNSLINLLLLKSIKIFILSLIIDYLRHLLFTILRIKKILIFVETKLKEILS